MTKKEEETTNTGYSLIVRVKESGYAHFAEKLEGNVNTDKFVYVYVTTKKGEKKKITLPTDLIAGIEETIG